MCVQDEIAISAVVHGGDGMGTGRNRTPCPLLTLHLTWIKNRGQFKNPNRPVPLPQPKRLLLSEQGTEGLLIQKALCVYLLHSYSIRPQYLRSEMSQYLF